MGWTSFNDNGLSTGEICTREFTSTNPAGDRWSVVDQSTRGSVWYAIGRVGPVCGLFVMISQPFCRFCRSLAYIWLLAYINVCLYAYIPMRLYKATLNKGQKTPKCHYAFRKKNFEEKKCFFLTEA